MKSTLQFVFDYKKRVIDLEKNLHIPGYAPRETEQVIWFLDNPVHLWSLISSLADKKESVANNSLLKQKTRCLPLIINYSESFMIELILDISSKYQKFRISC